MHTIFKPSPADFDRSYTATCKSSIDDYILKLMEACDQTGDGALKAAGGKLGNIGDVEDKPEPVWVVGWVLQHILARSCRQDASKQYCHFSSAGNNNKFACSNTCGLQFYTLAHNYPGSHWFFNYYFLIDQSSWWEEYFVLGWATAVSCGAVESKPAHAQPPTATTATATATKATATPSASASGKASTGSSDKEGSPEMTASAGGASGTATTTASGSLKTSGSGRLRNPFALLF